MAHGHLMLALTWILPSTWATYITCVSYILPNTINISVNISTLSSPIQNLKTDIVSEDKFFYFLQYSMHMIQEQPNFLKTYGCICTKWQEKYRIFIW